MLSSLPLLPQYFIAVSVSPELFTCTAIIGATTVTTLLASTLYNKSKFNRAKAELQKKEKRYRNLLKQAPVSILIHCNHSIVYANQACLDNLGFEDERHILKKSIWDIVDQESENLVKQRIKKIRSTPDSHLVDNIKLRRNDGEVIDVEVMSNHTEHNGTDAIQVAFIDITQRLHSERNLLQNKQRLDLALLGGSLSIWDLDVRNDHAVVNDYFYEMTGYSKENFELSRYNWNTLIHPEDLPNKEALWELLLSGETKSYEAEYRIKSPNNTWIWIQDSGNIVDIDQHGQATRVVGTYREITKRKTAEANLIKERNLAKKANQAKDEFLSMMSHEMRTPLNPIIGFSNILLSQSKDPETQSYLKTINEAGLHLNTLIKDILDFSKIETGGESLEIETFNLRELCRSVVSFCLPEINKKNILFESKILLEANQSESLVRGDSMKIKQILTNLISNACKYTNQGSISLTCTAHRSPQGTSLFQFDIKDSGIGISPAELEPIFEPFRQSDSSYARRYEGIGLGLAICKRYAQLMNGTIEAQSELGSGSLFTLKIPLKAANANTLGISNKSPIVHWASNSKILVVEDNSANRDFIISAIKRIGCSPDYVTNGQEALDAIEKNNYDLVFMDVRMPVLDGIQATQKLRSLENTLQDRLPIIGLSAHVAEKDKRRCFEAGMDDYLTKPFHLDKLDQILQKWLPAKDEKKAAQTA